MLQTDIPAERRDIPPSIETDNTIDLGYLGSRFVLEKKEEKKERDGTMLLVFEKEERDEKRLVASYYITNRIWEELQHLKQVLNYGSDGPPSARAYIARAAANSADANAKDVEAEAQQDEADVKKADAIRRIYAQRNSAHYIQAAGNYNFAAHATRAAAESTSEALEARGAALAAVDTAKRAENAAASQATLVVKGKKEFWRNMITGGVMTFEEVCDEIILNNQHVSTRLSNDWLLPINLSLSEEKLLKILNLFALFLQTKKVVKVHWSIPASLSCISALLEFSTTIRLWLYSKINVLFCYIMHSICDRLPRSCRRQVYSLGNWVENLKPSNDIRVKVVKEEMRAIISEGAKVDKKGAKFVHVLEEQFTNPHGVVEKQFRCPAIDSDIRCAYLTERQMCEISAAGFSAFYVKCKDDNEFMRIITLVGCIAENGCGSLISCCPENNYGSLISCCPQNRVRENGCGSLISCCPENRVRENGCGSLISCCPKNIVRVRGFEETITSYVNIGLPPVYTLELGSVTVI